MDNHLRNSPVEETPPKPGAMINTFRAFGYNPQTAIADIVDNSITAKAENVWIEYRWNGKNSWVSITDDGQGMDKEELVRAMTPGSKDPKDDRDVDDLGRFGLGLKTSSFSQCKALTVITKKDDHNIIKRHWDLDYVNETGRWNLLDYLSDEDFKNPLKELKHGTTVLWEKLDRLAGDADAQDGTAQNAFLEEFEKIEDHLSLVFHRFMEKKKLSIWMNGRKIEPWDPFMRENPGSQIIASEPLDRNQITVKCFVLPHLSNIKPEDRKKAKTEDWYQMQGYYIYRNNRLLLYGDWLGLFSKGEHFKNARILVDISNKLDHEWKIDIKKATAFPPHTVRKDLIRLGKLARKKAGDVYRFRGNQIMLSGTYGAFDFQPVWKAKKGRDEVRHYYINDEHYLIKNLLEKESITPAELKLVLRVIGETIPVESIIQFQSEEPESHELRSPQSEPDPGLIKLAKRMYASLMQTGISHDLATGQILNIEPFNQYPQLIEYFGNE